MPLCLIQILPLMISMDICRETSWFPNWKACFPFSCIFFSPYLQLLFLGILLHEMLSSQCWIFLVLFSQVYIQCSSSTLRLLSYSPHLWFLTFRQIASMSWIMISVVEIVCIFQRKHAVLFFCVFKWWLCIFLSGFFHPKKLS